MERQLTFPLMRISSLLFCLALLIALISQGANAFFPSFPKKLTLLTESGQYSPPLCPTLSKLSRTNNDKALSSPFTLLNWNIYKQQRENWKINLEDWAEQADLITLQEAELSATLLTLIHQNGLIHVHNIAFEKNQLAYGVNTLSKTPPLSVCGNLYKEPWIMIPKTGLATTYSLKGSDQTLLLINIHGVNFTLTKKPLNEQLAPYIQLAMQHKGPIIFSGDFNTWSNVRLVSVEKALITAGFSEALFTQDKRMKVFGLPLDHIFFRGLKVIKAQSVETDASDHSPQLISFELE